MSKTRGRKKSVIFGKRGGVGGKKGEKMGIWGRKVVKLQGEVREKGKTTI